MRRMVIVAASGEDEMRLVAAFAVPNSGIEVVRRCADLAEVLSSAASGVADVVLIHSEMRGLSAEAIERLEASGVGIVGLGGSEESSARLENLGVCVVAHDETAERVTSAILAVRPVPNRTMGMSEPDATTGDRPPPLVENRGSESDADRTWDSYGPRRWATPMPGPGAGARSGPRALPDSGEPEDTGEEKNSNGDASAGHDGADSPAGASEGSRKARLIAVWGPTGAPGRSSLAVNLAAELAGAGREVLLVDLDTQGASLGQLLGVLDASPGLAAAARAAGNGVIDPVVLERLCPYVDDSCRLLGGIARAERWIELRPLALAKVWEIARSQVDFIVADVGFGLETDEELSYDTLAPRRYGAELGLLGEADTVLAVARADAIGIVRFARAIDRLREVTSGEVHIVANRMRPGVSGRSPSREVADALARHAGCARVWEVADDPNAFDRALVEGLPLRSIASRSPARADIVSIAEHVGELEIVSRGLRRRRRHSA